MVAADKSATLVAIARDEGRYIVEWLAHHFAIGFARILVYDHGSVDSMPSTLDRIAAVDRRLKRVPWQVAEGSPQVSAYNHGLAHVTTPWIAFLDLDEFLVPHADGSLPAYLARVPDDVACIHINWRGFGSGGRETDDYALVTRTFTRCARPSWDNNCHFKTLARTALTSKVLVHDVDVRSGRSVLSDFQEAEVLVRGQSKRSNHKAIQINHYQSKTYVEFEQRMLRGSANYVSGHPGGIKNATFDRFQKLDRNEEEDLKILQFDDAFRFEYDRLKRILA